MNGHTSGKTPPSPIEQAIDTVEAPAPMARVQIRVSTGRQVVVSVPLDLSMQEALDLIGYIASQLPGELAKARAAHSPLLIATAPLPSS